MLPGNFAADLPLERCAGRTDRGKIGFERGRVLAHVLLRDIGKALVHFIVSDGDVGGLGLLNLQGFVDQVAHHLGTQALLLFGAQLARVGIGEQGITLVNVGPGDDLAVDDRGGVAMVGVHLAEKLRVRRQIEIALRIGRCGRRRFGRDRRNICVLRLRHGHACGGRQDHSAGQCHSQENRRRSRQQAKCGRHGSRSILLCACRNGAKSGPGLRRIMSNPA
jgi:hypothetical protein